MNGAGQLVGDAVDAHLPLGHRLQQRRLGLGRCPVDLVGEKQVGEDRSAAEFETARLHVVDRRAEQVGGQQVRGELHAREVQTQRRGEGPGDQRLAEAGQVLDQHVPAREHGRENQRERSALADHDPSYLVEHRLAVGGRRRSGQPHIRRHTCSNRRRISSRASRPGPGSSVAGPGHVLRIHPRPQLCPEQHAAGGVKRRVIPGLPLSGGQLELPGQHRTQVPVPVPARGLRPADQRLGPRQPAAQRLRGVIAQCAAGLVPGFARRGTSAAPAAPRRP